MNAILTRRRAVALFGAGLGVSVLSACGASQKWHSTDITGSSPALDFTMTRASDGKEVSAAAYRGKIVMLYFGYTFCPDVCPTTLANLAQILNGLKADADNIRVLFVTVDPNRDTLPILAEYVANFGPQFDGLRGTPDQLASLARRFRVVYSVTPAHGSTPYEVTHGSAIYVFDPSGKARFLVSSLATANPDVAGTEADLKRLIAETHPS